MPPIRSQADDDDTIGPNSRYMSVVNQGLAQQRRCQIVQDLDARMTQMKIQVMERNALIQDHRYKLMQRKLRGNLERNLAYKLVVDEHNIATSSDYHSALNVNYTYDALKPEVQRMMQRLKPSYIREQKAKMQLQRAKDAQKVIIDRNLRHPSLQTARDREKRNRERQKRQKRESGADAGAGVAELELLRRDRSDVIVPSSGDFLLNRWANAFKSKTPISSVDDVSLPQGAPLSDAGMTDAARRPSEKGGNFFKKVGLLLKRPQGAHALIPSPYSNNRNNNRKLKPILAMSLDGRKSDKLKSETGSFKAMSVDGNYNQRHGHVVNDMVSGSELEDAEMSAIAQWKKRQRKRYTLPPIKVKRSSVKGNPQ